MSFNLGGSSKKQKINQTTTGSGTLSGLTAGATAGQSAASGVTSGASTVSSASNPWAPTQRYLEDLLGRLGTAGAGLGTPSEVQTGALAELAGNAGASTQYLPSIEALTRDLFATQSQAPVVGDAYSTLQSQIGGIASGRGVNPLDDPNMRALLESVGSDAANRVNSMFAGAGRDLSGAHTAALGRGVTQAQLPILVSQYNTNRDRQLGAAQGLYGAGAQTASAQAALDAAAADLRSRGIDTAGAVLEALNMPASTRLEVENMRRTLPVGELGTLASPLVTLAGLGSQTTGQQTQATEQAQFQTQLQQAIERILQEQQQKQRTTGTTSQSGSQWGLGMQWPSIK